MRDRVFGLTHGLWTRLARVGGRSTREGREGKERRDGDRPEGGAPGRDPRSRRPCQPVPRRLRDAALVGEGEPAVHLVEAHPRDVDRLTIGVVLDGQLAAEGFEQVVVDVLVHSLGRRREPVVDGPELDEHAPDDPGLLRDLAGGGLDERLARLDVPLGRHHSMRPARLRRAMIAMRAQPSLMSTTMPPAERSSTAGRRRPLWGLGGSARSCRHHNQGTCRAPRSGAGPTSPQPFAVRRARPRALVSPPSARRARRCTLGWSQRRTTTVWRDPGTHGTPAGGAHGTISAWEGHWRAHRGWSPHPTPGDARPETAGPPARGLSPARARAAASHRARQAVRGSGARDRARRRAGARCLPRADSPDLDFTTDASPDEILAAVEGWADAHWDIGREFGTIGLRKGEHHIEITTYRADTYDRTCRKPEVMFGDTLEGDLVRRDFTVNAMAIRLPSLEFVDLHGGLADLAARRLMTPAPPEESFADDPLRMMRAARFAAQLGFDVAPEVRAAMTERAATSRSSRPSGSATSSPSWSARAVPAPGLALLVDTGLADHFIPSCPRCASRSTSTTGTRTSTSTR